MDLLSELTFKMLSIIQSYLGREVFDILKNLTIAAMFVAYFKLAVAFFSNIPSLIIMVIRKSQNNIDVATKWQRDTQTPKKNNKPLGNINSEEALQLLDKRNRKKRISVPLETWNASFNDNLPDK